MAKLIQGSTLKAAGRPVVSVSQGVVQVTGVPASHGGGRGRRLRKGAKPPPKKFFLVEEIPPGQVEMRQAAGQHLVRRADGIWIWPVENQRRYQEEHP